MLLATFPDLPLDHAHLDLCCVGRQLGYHGGLKAIEAQIGIQRRTDLRGMSGADAGRLWNRWRHGRDDESKERLLAYNDGAMAGMRNQESDCWPITKRTV
jgi:uncharacterized protein YprB with RNaseH-like and TPR domain